MRIALIENWKQAWRFHTVIIAAALGLLNWVVSHPDFLTPEIAAALASVLPPNVMSAINRWVPLLLIFARLIKQQIPAPPAPPTPAAPAPTKEPTP